MIVFLKLFSLIQHEIGYWISRKWDFGLIFLLMLTVALQVPFQEITPDLVDTPLLQRLGFVVNRKVQLMICTHCRTVVSKLYCAKHARDQHKLSLSSTDANELIATFHQFALYDQLPSTGNDVIPAIEGLEPVQVYTCLECPAAYPKLDSIQKHHRQQHPTIPRPEKWPLTMGQQLNRSTSNTWFRVSTIEYHTPRTQTDEMVAQIESAVQATIPASTDVRNVTPWLRITRWHEYTKDYVKSDLRKMVAYPNFGELLHLKTAVQQFWEKASNLIDSTSLLVLERLNTPHPEKT